MNCTMTTELRELIFGFRKYQPSGEPWTVLRVCGRYLSILTPMGSWLHLCQRRYVAKCDGIKF